MSSTIAELSLRVLIVSVAWLGLRSGPQEPKATGLTSELPSSPADATTPAPPCPDGMVLVDGDFCDDVEQTCLRERPRPHLGCLEYGAPTVCKGAQKHMRFCIDDYEYPNRAGEKPEIMQSWYDADRQCRAESRRVCMSHEWTLACEGPDRWPYPYGYVRSSKACHIDDKGPMIDEKRFYSVDRDEEIARIDRREPSGARPGCVSRFGVHDLTGNIDEWTTNETGIPDHGALKGGNWGEWRNACRPTTRGHAAWFRYYQMGFRCCSDAR
jgi:formylglycine-generating enzyme